MMHGQKNIKSNLFYSLLLRRNI